jgi:hypothetical protein
MKLKFELVTYNEALNRFTLDETMYEMEISDEEAQSYELFKSSDLNLYNWLKESDFFINYIRDVIYTDGDKRKIAISDINGTTYRRFYFFKVTSSDSHYQYFKDLFNIYEESDWQDREEIGEEILDHLFLKRKELIIDLEKSTMMDTNASKV